PYPGIRCQLSTYPGTVFPCSPRYIVSKVIPVIYPDPVIIRKLMADGCRQVRPDNCSGNLKIHTKINTGFSLKRFGCSCFCLHPIVQTDILCFCPECRTTDIRLNPGVFIQTEGSACLQTATKTILVIIAFHCRAITHPGAQFITETVDFDNTVHIVTI